MDAYAQARRASTCYIWYNGGLGAARDKKQLRAVIVSSFGLLPRDASKFRATIEQTR